MLVTFRNVLQIPATGRGCLNMRQQRTANMWLNNSCCLKWGVYILGLSEAESGLPVPTWLGATRLGRAPTGLALFVCTAGSNVASCSPGDRPGMWLNGLIWPHQKRARDALLSPLWNPPQNHQYWDFSSQNSQQQTHVLSPPPEMKRQHDPCWLVC